MNRERLLTDAKVKARAMAMPGIAPCAATDIAAPGVNALATLKLAVWTMHEAQYISDHDAKVANWVRMLCAEGTSLPAHRSANSIYLTWKGSFS